MKALPRFGCSVMSRPADSIHQLNVPADTATVVQNYDVCARCHSPPLLDAIFHLCLSSLVVELLTNMHSNE